MDSDWYMLVASTAVVIFVSFVVQRYFANTSKASRQFDDERTRREEDIMRLQEVLEPNSIARQLWSLLPGRVTLAQDAVAMKEYRDTYWAGQCRDVFPACVVHPQNTKELSLAVKILKSEYESRRAEGDAGGYLFAIRSGGHSPNDSHIGGGAIVDMRAFNAIQLSEDNAHVTIGSGARWGNVVEYLEKYDLAVVGGRDEDVGVGGLTLGGGISYYSPKYGFVASNVVSFEIIIANGRVTTASATEHSDLWRALKGGSSNFGIVTKITLPTFPSRKIWAGFLLSFGFEAARTLKAFHQWTDRNLQPGTDYDEDIATPFTCFAYTEAHKAHAVGTYLCHTNPPEGEKSWPGPLKASPFYSLWRFWSTCKLQTLSSAMKTINAYNPSGLRQVFSTVTVKNDLETLQAAHAIHMEAVERVREARNVQDLKWNLVMQSVLPQWSTRGESGPMGFSESDTDPLVLMMFSTNWAKSEDDELVRSETRRAIEKIESMAKSKGTEHPYRYLNYCADWQKPFQGYGAENVKFLQETSKKYDADGLFQKACAGGFELFEAKEE